MTDADFMRRAIALAATHLGLTGDNPSVGCVIVAGGKVVGEGVTGLGGRPHAEERALAQAGAAAAGATAYVTLEPCAARTNGSASCSSLLIAAKIDRVVIATADASIYAAGHGPASLEASGIPIQHGVLADEAATLYRDYQPQGGKPLERPN